MIDVAAVTAIDVHTHAETPLDGHDPMPPRPARGGAALLPLAVIKALPTAEDVAAYYRER